MTTSEAYLICVTDSSISSRCDL